VSVGNKTYKQQLKTKNYKEKFIRICQADQLAETGEDVCCQAAEEGLLRDDWDAVLIEIDDCVHSSIYTFGGASVQ
jgi:hypothetical protein